MALAKRNLCLILFVLFITTSWSQESEEEFTNRLYMPSLQMGYINNHTDQLSGGLFIQTSIEYKTKSGLFFRLNYDDFDTDYSVEEPQQGISSLNGKVSFSEFIGGFGYRHIEGKHNLLVSAQAGGRFYGFPVLENEQGDLRLDLESRETAIGRYTLGYEYEIDVRAFLTFEFFASHTFQKKDYWTSKTWATGFTIGVTTTIF